ncbi:hypothetical protein [Roseovarius rhodophyticola]|uniref:Uncharacterized protein n=1 Tax=Roseovarius rhodophyticola TaxID=3080827 RepID=A0ABZ2TCI3_9RHOB|nr:hypothetical protein [Roseovarius sp. W115]
MLNETETVREDIVVFLPSQIDTPGMPHDSRLSLLSTGTDECPWVHGWPYDPR